VQSNKVDIVVIDSVAALVPKEELDGEIGDSNVGAQARLMSQTLRKLSSDVRKSKTCILFINQIRETIGSISWGPHETTPGGRALKFYASVRMDIRRIGSVKEGEKIVSNTTRVKVVKNKVAPPFRLATFDIRFGEGICTAGSLIDLGVAQGLIKKSGTFFNYGSMKLGNGKMAAVNSLKGDQATMAEIDLKLRELLFAGQIAAPSGGEDVEEVKDASEQEQ
jgi:recombination protein RecA